MKYVIYVILTFLIINDVKNITHLVRNAFGVIISAKPVSRGIASGLQHHHGLSHFGRGSHTSSGQTIDRKKYKPTKGRSYSFGHANYVEIVAGILVRKTCAVQYVEQK